MMRRSRVVENESMGYRITAEQTHEILVVDDDPIIRMFLAEGLAQAGYEVMTAENGAVGLELVATHRPDAVVLDLLMPVMDGWAFLAERDLLPQLAGLPIVVLSAAGRDPLRDADALGATAVLAKPLDLTVLSDVLEHVLRMQSNRAASPSVEALTSEEPEGSRSTKQPLGLCPICATVVSAPIAAGLTFAERIRVIHAGRQAHVLSHSAAEIADVPLRTRLLGFPVGRRRILSNWVYRELRCHWGDLDRTGVHSIEETLASPALHRFWQDANA